jgi:hypothetical protein
MLLDIENWLTGIILIRFCDIIAEEITLDISPIELFDI